MNYAIILAGGIGSRFWPQSTQALPKQFLKLFSDKPLLRESIDRVRPLVNKNNIYIATNKAYRKLTLDCLKDVGIPKKNFLFEREAKNTFAPIAVLSQLVFNKDKEAVIAVFPSDHFIKNKNEFLKALKKAIILAKDGNIVTLGVVPKSPETGFGYIKTGIFGNNGYKVEKFIEKPDLKTAKKLIKDKRYYWNGGIFVFKAKTLLDEINRIHPAVYKLLFGIGNRIDFEKPWKKFPFISIDYAIMEKSQKLRLIPLDCGWSDLGSWQALEEVKPKDKNGNIFMCKIIDMGSRGTTVLSNRLVATIGLNDLIIVDAKDALLVCSKHRAQDVKRLVELLKLKKV